MPNHILMYLSSNNLSTNLFLVCQLSQCPIKDHFL